MPDAAEGETTRCPFCGLVHDAARVGESSVRVPRIEFTPQARVPGWVVALILVVMLGGVAFAGVSLFIGWRAASTSVDLANRVVSGLANSGKTAARSPAQLKNLPSGHHALDAAPPAGGYGAVDPIGALPWALTIAQAWSADARLERIDVSRLRPDGTVNVEDDAEASLTYQFRSPSVVNALLDQARLQPSAEAGVGLWVRVKQGEPQVYSDVARGSTLRENALVPHPDAEPLTTLLKRSAVARLRADLPFLNAYLIHVRDEGWVWYFSSLANESRPRVRARDGAVWPYSRKSL